MSLSQCKHYEIIVAMYNWVNSEEEEQLLSVDFLFNWLEIILWQIWLVISTMSSFDVLVEAKDDENIF